MKTTLTNIFDVSSLLLEEQYRHEKIIGLLRLLTFGVFLVITIITDGIIEQDQERNHIVLFVVINIIALCMYFETTRIGYRFIHNSLYTTAHNIIVPFLDVALIAFLTFHVIDLETSAYEIVTDFTFIYLLAAALVILMNIFRFSIISSLVSGLSIIAFHFSFTYYLNNFLLIKPAASESEDSSIYFYTAILLFAIISVLLARIIKSLLVKSKKQELLNRFLPDTLAREMVKSESLMHLEGERVNAVILFSDIRSFTTLTESMAPEEVITMLNNYFAEMIEIVFQYKGTLDKLIGDGMMALFGAFDSDNMSAENAVSAAIAMQNRLKEINSERRNDSLPEIQIGIGIHRGEVVIGGVGTENRMDFTALGDTVNTASRIEALTKELNESILISASVKDAIGEKFFVKECGTHEIRGKKELTSLFSIKYETE